VPPATPSSLYSSVVDAMTAAGVDAKRAKPIADQVDAAVSRKISSETADLWWYGKAAASVIPLWVLALVAVLPHKRPEVDLSRLEYLVWTAERIEAERLG
jgi:hypothetical protein